jgi:hypothetical protein
VAIAKFEAEGITPFVEVAGNGLTSGGIEETVWLFEGVDVILDD